MSYSLDPYPHPLTNTQTSVCFLEVVVGVVFWEQVLRKVGGQEVSWGLGGLRPVKHKRGGRWDRRGRASDGSVVLYQPSGELGKRTALGPRQSLSLGRYPGGSLWCSIVFISCCGLGRAVLGVAAEMGPEGGHGRAISSVYSRLHFLRMKETLCGRGS